VPYVLIDLFTLHFVIAFGIVILGGIMHGYTGWGGGIVMMPLMTLIFSPIDSLAMICIGGLLTSIQLYPRAVRTANWGDMRAIYIALLIMTPVGTLLLGYLDPGVVRKCMGVLIIAASLLILTGWQYRGKRGVPAASLFGGASGLINGFSGVGGPLFVIYVIAHPDEPRVQRANIIIGAGLVIFLITSMLSIMGSISGEIFIKGILLAPGQMLGGWLGARLFNLAPQEYFKKITLIAIVVLGLSAAIF
jgi:uncharacterized membrane protein YfcA